MKLRSGQSFKWVRISDREFRVVVEAGKPPGPLSVLGYARKKRPLRRTGSWMQELRAGEKTP